MSGKSRLASARRHRFTIVGFPWYLPLALVVHDSVILFRQNQGIRRETGQAQPLPGCRF
jgi:hypothetical protein